MPALEDQLFTLLARRGMRKPRKPPGQPGPEFIPPGSNLGGRDGVALQDRGTNRAALEPGQIPPSTGLSAGFLGLPKGSIGNATPGATTLLAGSGPPGDPLASGVAGSGLGPHIVNPFAGPTLPPIPAPMPDIPMAPSSSAGLPGPEFEEGDDADLVTNIMRRLLTADPLERDRALSILTRLGRGVASPYLSDAGDSGGDITGNTRGTTLIDYLVGDEPDLPFP